MDAVSLEERRGGIPGTSPDPWIWRRNPVARGTESTRPAWSRAQDEWEYEWRNECYFMLFSIKYSVNNTRGHIDQWDKGSYK